MEYQFYNSTFHGAAHLDATASMGRRRSSNGSAPSASINSTSSDNMTVDQIEDVLARIVHRVDLQESHEGDGSTAERWNEDNTKRGSVSDQKGRGSDSNGPLASRELSELTFLCSTIAAAMTTSATTNVTTNLAVPSMIRTTNQKKSITSFANADIDIVLSVIELLDRHVNLAVATNIIESSATIVCDTTKSPSQVAAALEQWLSNGEGHVQLNTLRNGLEAAAIIIFIISTPNIDRRVVIDDAIRGVITLIRLHLSRHLLPALNQTGHFSSDGMKKKDPPGSPPTSKRRRVSDASEGALMNSKDVKKVYKYISSTIGLQLTLMERIEGLMLTLPLDDQQVLMLTSGVLPVFEIDCTSSSSSNAKEAFQARQLQTTSISVLTAAFRQYPMHRDIILEDLFPIMLNLPSGKRSLRTFPVRYSSSPSTTLQALNMEVVGPLISNGSEPHFIQNITALILSFVHSCVLRPSYVAEEKKTDPEGNNGAATSDKLQSGLRSSIVVADTFVRFLLKRCTKGKGDSANEFRPVLTSIVEDLLLVLLIPEYPAAELLLAALQRRLNQDLSAASPIFKTDKHQPPPEVTYLNCALDVMGKICSVQARLLAFAEDKSLRIITEVPMSNTSSSEQDMDCHCKKHHTDVLRVQCDQCNSIFHGNCVGLPDEESIPEQWFCDCCVLGRIVVREQQSSTSSGGDTSLIDGVYAMRYAFQSAAMHQMRLIDQSLDDPIKFHLARWIDEIDRKEITQTGLSLKRSTTSKLLEYWDSGAGLKKDVLSDEGNIRIIVSLLTQTSQFFISFRKQIEFLLKHLSDENSQVLRKLSLKVIEKCVEGDQNLMLLPIIKKAVSKRLSDESISVREAAVALIGNYIARSHVAISGYHAVLLPCLSDPGVSVRKRAVKIFQSILIKNPHYQCRVEVFKELIHRSIDPKEEDSVRDLIDEVLYILWFRSGTIPVGQQRALSDADSVTQPISIPGVVTPNTPVPPARRKSMQSRSDVTAEQMMEVMQAGNVGKSLEAVLVKLVNGECGVVTNVGRKQPETTEGFKADGSECTDIVDSLCELLVVIDEQREIRPNVGRDISATLKTLAIFATVSPVALLKHFDTILPYLKADNGVSMEDESGIICATCDILYRLAPVLDHQTINRQTSISISKDMTKLSYKFGPAVLLSTIRAFSTLANQSSNLGHSAISDKLLSLAKTFYSYAMKRNDIDDFSTVNDQLKNSVHRSLTVLGVICEYRAVALNTATWQDDIGFEGVSSISESDLSWDTYTLACYSLFKNYLLKKDSGTKCRALAALKGIFVAYPQLLLQLDHVGLFEEIMADEAGEPLQLEALECWRNILEAEERRIDSGQAEAKMEAEGKVTLSKRISGDQNGDATLFGGVLTNHSTRLFEMTKDPRATIRWSTLQLLGLLLRQGLLNPNEVIPHLFALQGDTGNESVRTRALQLLISEGEKRPDTLRQRICSGVKEAYYFQKAVYDKVSAVVVSAKSNRTIVQSIFGSVFEECIVKNRKQRLGLYKTLLGIFEVDQSADDAIKTDNVAKDLSLLSFAAQILAHLPYNTASDPLYIIYHLTSIIVLQGQYVTDRMSQFLRQHGVPGRDDLDDSNTIEDAFEKAASSKFPSRTQEARLLSKKSFDLKTFTKLVHDGTTISLLLRLKTFLCKMYHLSEIRCMEYEPEEKGRLSEKGISPIEISEAFDATIAATTETLDKDLLLRQYAEFRSLMRLENSLQVRASSIGGNIDDEQEVMRHKRLYDEDNH